MTKDRQKESELHKAAQFILFEFIVVAIALDWIKDISLLLTTLYNAPVFNGGSSLLNIIISLKS